MRPELKRFLELYEAGAYFDSHETLEPVWLQGRSPLDRGLIQIAAAFCKRDRGNGHGLVRNLAKAHRELAGCAPASSGIDVARLRDEIRRRLENLRRAGIATGCGVSGDGALEPSRLQALAPHIKIPVFDALHDFVK